MPFYNYGNDAFNENSTAGSLNPNWRTKNQKSIVVKVDTLDCYIEINKIEKIDLIKLDVETFEVHVLEGYMKYLKIHKATFIIEVINTEIGKLLMKILNKEEYIYYNIDEINGLINVREVGDSRFNNYLIFHKDYEILIRDLFKL